MILVFTGEEKDSVSYTKNRMVLENSIMIVLGFIVGCSLLGKGEYLVNLLGFSS